MAKTALDLIQFSPELSGCVGVEQEFFLGYRAVYDHTSSPSPWVPGHTELVSPLEVMPRSPEFLDLVKPEDSEGRWTYELSACQVEFRSAPQKSLFSLARDLYSGKQQGEKIARQMGLDLMPLEVAPQNMPLDVYPHNERYQTIAASMPDENLRAACQVAGIHIHVGCRDIEDAIQVHNKLVRQLHHLMVMGDSSQGKRLELYRKVVGGQVIPPLYESAEHFCEHAEEAGFSANLSNCWYFVRITRFGTVEVRVFGNTASIARVIHWAQTVRNIAAG